MGRGRARAGALAATVALLLTILVLHPGGGAPASASAAIRARAGFSAGNGWLNLSEADLTADLDAMQAARVRWLRLTISWVNLQPTTAGYAWNRSPQPLPVSHLELVLKGAAARGIKVIGVVATTPAWARPSGCTAAACRPARPADYATFLRAAVGRYRKAPYGVHTWEVWNMPNTKTFHLPAPDATQYAALLKAAAPAIRAADPNATVLLGGLGSGTTVCPKPTACIAPLTFLGALYDRGVKGTFDGVDLHAVSEDGTGQPVPPMTPAPGNVFADLPSYHDLVVSRGDDATVWAEVGYPGAKGITEDQQATYVGDALRQWVTYPWGKALVVYNVRDVQGEMAGVLRGDGTPKPAYSTFASLTA